MKKFTSLLLTLCIFTLCPLTSTAQKRRASKPVTRASRLRNADQPLRATGGFIQLDDAEMRFTKWPELLGELNTKAGMDTFIIQRLFFRYNGPPRSHIALKEGSINVNDPQYNPSMVLAANDPTNAILNYADQTYSNANQSDDMKIYVGLWMDEMPWKTVVEVPPAELEAYLNGIAEKLIKVTNLAWSLYHQHPSFRGWYISHEFWNFPYGDGKEASQRKQDLFKKFLNRVVPDGFGTAAGNTQAMRAGLFDQYVRTFVNQPYNPQPGLQQFTGPVVTPRRRN
jgi:Domain of unknown function (DUF4434)